MFFFESRSIEKYAQSMLLLLNLPALDFVNCAWANHGDYFSIDLAGYPDGHPDAIEQDPSQNPRSGAPGLPFVGRPISKKKCRDG